MQSHFSKNASSHLSSYQNPWNPPNCSVPFQALTFHWNWLTSFEFCLLLDVSKAFCICSLISVQRSIYKDLVLLLQRDQYLTLPQLKSKVNLSHSHEIAASSQKSHLKGCYVLLERKFIHTHTYILHINKVKLSFKVSLVIQLIQSQQQGEFVYFVKA